MKKKIFAMFALLLLFIPSFVFAKSYDVDEYLKLDFDDDWYVFTKSNIKDNKELEELGVSEEYMENLFKSSNVVVDAILFADDNNDTKEVFVRTTETKDLYNLNDNTDSYINEFADGFISSVKEQGIDVVNSKVYKSNNNAYVYLEYFDSNLNVIEYFTVVNGNGYAIQVQKTNSFTESEKDSFEEIIDKASFKILKQEKNDDNNKEQEKENNKNLNYVTNIIVGAVIGALVGALYGLIYTKRKAKKNKSEK